MSVYALPIRISCDEVRTRPAMLGVIQNITANYEPIGISFTRPVRIFHIQNFTDNPLMFSYDGVNDNFPLNSFSFLLLDIAANQALAQGFFMGIGARLYVRDMQAEGYNPPTVGAVWLTVYAGSL